MPHLEAMKTDSTQSKIRHDVAGNQHEFPRTWTRLEHSAKRVRKIVESSRVSRTDEGILIVDRLRADSTLGGDVEEGKAWPVEQAGGRSRNLCVGPPISSSSSYWKEKRCVLGCVV